MKDILLVHGLLDTTKDFKIMSAYLTNLGFQVHAINLIPNNGNADLADLAQQVKNYIDSNFEPKTKINLLGFSMGGIVTRYYLQRLNGIEKVDKYINISAPNNGTILSFLLPLKGILQMRPQSKFLQDLNQDVQEKLSQIKTLILWTSFDLMILPPKSSKLGLKQEICLPILLHPCMLRDRRVLKLISDFLT
jgi:triacylglycerol lipase